jgi:hypothetical protein
VKDEREPQKNDRWINLLPHLNVCLVITAVFFSFPYNGTLVDDVLLEVEHTLQLTWHASIGIRRANTICFRDHQVLQRIFRQMRCQLCKLNDATRKSLGKIGMRPEKVL